MPSISRKHNQIIAKASGMQLFLCFLHQLNLFLEINHTCTEFSKMLKTACGLGIGLSLHLPQQTGGPGLGEHMLITQEKMRICQMQPADSRLRSGTAQPHWCLEHCCEISHLIPTGVIEPRGCTAAMSALWVVLVAVVSCYSCVCAREHASSMNQFLSPHMNNAY